jgi:hypothetical protein
MDEYSGRISYDGENAGRGRALFFVDREAGAIFFENCRVVLFPESSVHDPIFFENLQLAIRSFLKMLSYGAELFQESSRTLPDFFAKVR